jgi:hypothetical protein
MAAATLARVAKVVALLGFVLPWLTVSCSGQPLATASGLDLVLGHLSFRDPLSGHLQHQSGAPSVLLILALAAIVTGLILTFLLRGRPAAMAVIATASAAFVLSIAGEAAEKQIPRAGRTEEGHAWDAQTAALIHYSDRYGFLLTLAALAVAAGAGIASLRGASRSNGSG